MIRQFVILAALLLTGSTQGALAQAACSIDSLKQATDCFGKAFATADAAMQANYREAQDAVKTRSTYAAALSKSQDAWLAYRAATCDGFVQPFWGEGQLRDLAPLSCKLALTKARAADLDNMFHGLWGLQQ